MYLSFYNFKENPFNLTPDTHFLYLSKHHQMAMRSLLYGINERKGFILLTGEVGAGKTTLCRALLKELNEKINVAVVFNPYLSETGLLKTIIDDFSIETNAKTRADLLNVLGDFLISQRKQNKNVVLMIDECQNLRLPVIEQIRMISNLETEKDKLIQIILVGQPEFRQKITSPKLLQLNQRISVRYHIPPLNVEETKLYITHRIRVAGGHEVVFTDRALSVIYEYSKGVPRMINVLSDYALMAGFLEETKEISEKIVLRAIHEMSGAENEQSTDSSVENDRIEEPTAMTV
ncbi:MAG: AAA family ATPase [Candidatus Ancaeobacter aquaticus]|nr:AAA family ATPase [Candidatus Ancaeobacter aquaticus]